MAMMGDVSQHPITSNERMANRQAATHRLCNCEGATAPKIHWEWGDCDMSVVPFLFMSTSFVSK